MAAAKPIPFKKFGKPAAGPVRDKICPQSLGIIGQGTANNLFDLALMEINARPEHAAKIRRGAAGSKFKVSPGPPSKGRCAINLIFSLFSDVKWPQSTEIETNERNPLDIFTPRLSFSSRPE
jgi:hypothetical protein